MQGAEDDGGSPVDVAKSYMRALPPWASPSSQHGELRSTSPLGLQLFNEETPYSIGGTSITSKVTYGFLVECTVFILWGVVTCRALTLQ